MAESPRSPAMALPPELVELQRRFVDQLPERLKAMADIFHSIDATAGDRELLETLHRMVHSLTGTAGTFGFKVLSAEARLVESRLASMVHAPTSPTDSSWRDLETHLAKLVASGPGLCTESGTEAGQPSTDAATATVERTAVHLVTDRSGSTELLQSALSEAGFEVQLFAHPQACYQAHEMAHHHLPAAVVLDMMGTSDAETVSSMVRQLDRCRQAGIPIVVTLERDDLVTRLAAFRAGARNPLPHPLNPGQLCEALDRLTEHTTQKPWRVLLIDDEPLQLQAHAIYLRRAGMEVHTLTDPMLALNDIDHFEPDVVVLDVYMPGASGPELAAVLRESEVHRHLPILFLSAETSMTQQLLALDLGGDDFLIKPVQPAHLVAAVTARARRYRQDQAVRRRLDTTLYEREREHLALDQHAVVSITDAAGDITYANDLFCSLSGYRREEVLGRNHRFLNSGQHPASFFKALWERISSGQMWQGEICNRRQDGGLYWVATTITPFMSADGLAYQYVSIHTDISHIKAAEEARRKSESRLSFLVSSSPVTIYTRSSVAPYSLSYMSPNVGQLMAFEPSSFTDDPDFWLQQVHPDDRTRVREGLANKHSGEASHDEYRLRNGNGEYRWVHDRSRLACDESGGTAELVGYWVDITDRKRIEAELSRFNHELEQRVAEQTQSVMESERFARSTLDALDAQVLILDKEGTILAANRAWQHFTLQATARTKPEGLNYLDFCDEECGTSAPASTPLATGIREVIEGRRSDFLYEYTCHRSEEARWQVCRVKRFPGEGAVRVVVSHEDVTTMKLIEKQHMRSQRLESIGTLAGGIAHDLNNSLAPILMGIEILKEDYPKENKLIEMVQASAQRGAGMVKQLLAFAKGVDGERVEFEPAALLGELERLMSGSFPKNIALQVACGADVPRMVGDPTQLHQVLLNLCVNARDAMPHGGRLTVEARLVEIDDLYARTLPGAHAGAYVKLRVQDTGDGIPPQILDRIFDPFFTTKSAERGTGLGLSTVVGIVKGHQGFVQVHSLPGQGTVFEVYLPAGPVPTGPARPRDGLLSTHSFRGQGETVLFVDDEPALREVGSTVLKRLNCLPVTAVDGHDALNVFRTHGPTIKAIITDLHMPVMDGLRFIRVVRQSMPGIPIVVASGMVDEVTAKALRELGVNGRLDKPFTESQLADVLGAVLSGT